MLTPTVLLDSVLRPDVILKRVSNEYLITSTFSNKSIFVSGQESVSSLVFQLLTLPPEHRINAIGMFDKTLLSTLVTVVNELKRAGAFLTDADVEFFNQVSSINGFDKSCLNHVVRFWSRIPLSEIHAILKNTWFSIVGVGGIGTFVVEFLTRIGVHNFVLMDYDHVELSNLNRQVSFTFQDVGRLKIDATEERLRAINPAVNMIKRNVRVTDANQLLALCPRGSFLILPIHNVTDTSRRLFAEIWSKGLDHFQAILFSLNGRVGPLISGKPPCRYDNFVQQVEQIETSLFADFLFRNRANAATSAASISVIASKIAYLCFQELVLGTENDVRDLIEYINPRDMRCDSFRLKRHSN